VGDGKGAFGNPNFNLPARSYGRRSIKLGKGKIGKEHEGTITVKDTPGCAWNEVGKVG